MKGGYSNRIKRSLEVNVHPIIEKYKAGKLTDKQFLEWFRKRAERRLKQWKDGTLPLPFKRICW